VAFEFLKTHQKLKFKRLSEIVTKNMSIILNLEISFCSHVSGIVFQLFTKTKSHENLNMFLATRQNIQSSAIAISRCVYNSQILWWIYKFYTSLHIK
jgi:hypothetical protein